MKQRTSTLWLLLVVMPLLMGLGSINIRSGCNGDKSTGSSVYVDTPNGAGGLPGNDTASCGGPGQCSCTSAGYGFCGVCPTHPSNMCTYCPAGSYCPADPCSPLCPSMSLASCPAGYPVNCGNGECCSEEFPVCCYDGICATDELGCGHDDGDSGGGSYDCSVSNPQVTCSQLGNGTCGSCTNVKLCAGPAGSVCGFYRLSDSTVFGADCGPKNGCPGPSCSVSGWQACTTTAFNELRAHCGC